MGMLDYVVHRTNVTREAVRQRMIAGWTPRWILNSRRAPYIRQVIISTPGWVERDALKLIQERTRQLGELSGVEHHVSHIVPLTHPRVCGLTVPWNLEPKPARRNLSEFNHIHLDEQPDLFEA